MSYIEASFFIVLEGTMKSIGKAEYLAQYLIEKN